MSLALATRNVTRAYRAASDDDRTAGREWYAAAHRIAADLDPASPGRAAAVIAVLSPQLSWRRNVEAAHAVYGGHSPRCLKSNSGKAFRILAGEDPRDVVSGPKVRAFWLAIADPTDRHAVVIDRHALDIAAGRVIGEKLRDLYLGRKGAYDAASDLYRRAARALSRDFGPTLPSHVQAATWLYWRREHALANHG